MQSTLHDIVWYKLCVYLDQAARKTKAQLNRIGLNTSPGIEDVNMFKEDGAVLHFAAPKVQAAVTANTYVITGNGEEKQLEESLPGIINQLGPDNLANLKRIAERFAAQSANKSAADDDIPDIGENFEEVGKQ